MSHSYWQRGLQQKRDPLGRRSCGSMVCLFRSSRPVAQVYLSSGPVHWEYVAIPISPPVEVSQWHDAFRTAS